jgi:hypothetical protein
MAAVAAWCDRRGGAGPRTGKRFYARTCAAVKLERVLQRHFSTHPNDFTAQGATIGRAGGIQQSRRRCEDAVMTLRAMSCARTAR